MGAKKKKMHGNKLKKKKIYKKWWFVCFVAPIIVVLIGGFILIILKPKEKGDSIIIFGDFIGGNKYETILSNPIEYKDLDMEYKEEYNLKKARSLVEEGEIKEALLLFEDFIERHPDKWRVKSDVAYLYFLEGSNEKAINLMNQVINLVPSEAMPYYNLASTYYMSKQYDKALEWANKALELNKTSSRINRLLGLIFIKKQIPKKAIDKLKIAVDKLKTISTVNKTLLAETLADLGQAYGMNGDYKLSLFAYEEAVRNDSKIPRIYEGWAAALFFNGDIKGASEKIKIAEGLGHIVSPELRKRIIEESKKK